MKSFVFVDDGYPEAEDYASSYLPCEGPLPRRRPPAGPADSKRSNSDAEPLPLCNLRIGSQVVPCGHAILSA